MQKQIEEVMGLVNEVQKNRVCAEMSPSNKEHFNYLADKAFVAISDKLRELLPAWQPIESAPKDGTSILAWNSEFGARETKSVTYGEGSPGFAQGLKDRWWQWYEPQSGWAFKWKPTHWMPLPKAPE